MESTEGFTKDERRYLWTSALLGLAHLPLMGVLLFIFWLDQRVDFATLFGVDRYHVWVWLSEVVPIPLFFLGFGTWMTSCGLGIPFVQRQPACLCWLLSPLIDPFVFLIAASILDAK